MSYVFKRLKSTFGGGERKANCNFLASIGRLLEVLGKGGEIPPTFGPSGGGEISPGGEIPPHSGTVTGGEIPPGGGFPYPLKICSQKMCELCLCALHINWTILQH